MKKRIFIFAAALLLVFTFVMPASLPAGAAAAASETTEDSVISSTSSSSGLQLVDDLETIFVYNGVRYAFAEGFLEDRERLGLEYLMCLQVGTGLYFFASDQDFLLAPYLSLSGGKYYTYLDVKQPSYLFYSEYEILEDGTLSLVTESATPGSPPAKRIYIKTLTDQEYASVTTVERCEELRELVLEEYLLYSNTAVVYEYATSEVSYSEVLVPNRYPVPESYLPDYINISCSAEIEVLGDYVVATGEVFGDTYYILDEKTTLRMYDSSGVVVAEDSWERGSRSIKVSGVEGESYYAEIIYSFQDFMQLPDTVVYEIREVTEPVVYTLTAPEISGYCFMYLRGEKVVAEYYAYGAGESNSVLEIYQDGVCISSDEISGDISLGSASVNAVVGSTYVAVLTYYYIGEDGNEDYKVFRSGTLTVPDEIPEDVISCFVQITQFGNSTLQVSGTSSGGFYGETVMQLFQDGVLYDEAAWEYGSHTMTVEVEEGHEYYAVITYSCADSDLKNVVVTHTSNSVKVKIIIDDGPSFLNAFWISVKDTPLPITEDIIITPGQIVIYLAVASVVLIFIKIIFFGGF